MYNTIDELIAKLEEAREEMGGGTEVRFAFQESWPLRATISAITVPEPEDTEPHCDEHICFIKACEMCKTVMAGAIADGYDPEHPEEFGDKDADREMLWIALSDSPGFDERPYAPRWAWQ